MGSNLCRKGEHIERKTAGLKSIVTDDQEVPEVEFFVNRLASWTPTRMCCPSPCVNRNLYFMDFPAGSISLGANMAPSAADADSHNAVVLVG